MRCRQATVRIHRVEIAGASSVWPLALPATSGQVCESGTIRQWDGAAGGASAVDIIDDVKWLVEVERDPEVRRARRAMRRCITEGHGVEEE